MHMMRVRPYRAQRSLCPQCMLHMLKTHRHVGTKGTVENGRRLSACCCLAHCQGFFCIGFKQIQEQSQLVLYQYTYIGACWGNAWWTPGHTVELSADRPASHAQQAAGTEILQMQSLELIKIRTQRVSERMNEISATPPKPKKLYCRCRRWHNLAGVCLVVFGARLRAKTAAGDITAEKACKHCKMLSCLCMPHPWN